MARMWISALIGAVVGFVVLMVMFLMCTPPGPPERGIWFVFSIMGAIPVAAIASLFAAVSVIQAELRETQRAIKHWQSTFQLADDVDKPSTQFKPGPPRRD